MAGTRTFTMIKPDAVKHAGKIIERIEKEYMWLYKTYCLLLPVKFDDLISLRK